MADGLTSRDHSSVQMDKSPDIMRMVFKGSGSDPVLVLLLHIGAEELELDNCALRRPRNEAAPVLLTYEDHQTWRTSVSNSVRSNSPVIQTEPGRPTC